MLFEIWRSSMGYRNYDPENPPCEGAVRGEKTSVDTRAVNDPSQLRYDGKDWYKRGTNHRVENGQIKRDLGMELVWMLEVASLDELLALVAKEGKIVLKDDSIEIYDDYRE